MAKKIRMIGLDLDGTALTNEKQLTDATLEVLERAVEAGVFVVPATGRTLLGVPKALRHMSGIDYVITSNGAAVYDVKKQECVYEVPMPEKQAEKVIELICQYPVLADLFVGETGYLEEGRREYLYQVGFVDAVLDYIVDTHHWVPDLVKFVKEEKPKVQKIMVNFPDEALSFREELVEKLQAVSGLSVVCGGGTNLEVTNKEADKGEALLWVAKRKKVKKDELMAIGDSENDLSMIQCAGWSVAMANAVPCIKEAADFETGSNEEDGVAQAIDFFVLTQKDALFSPAVFAALTAVWGYAAWVLFSANLAPLTVPFLGIVIGAKVLREGYLVAFFLWIIYYLCLTPRHRTMVTLASLVAFPLCLYGTVRLFCLGGLWMALVVLFLLVGAFLGLWLGRKKERAGRLQIALFFALLAAGLIYVGSQYITREQEAKGLVERGQTEYLLERNWNVLRPFETEVFSTLSNEERIQALQDLADWEAHYLGLDPVVVVQEAFVRTDKTSLVLGTYQNTERKIRMNETVITRARRDECLEVLCHELYHAYQWALVEGDVGNGIVKAEQVSQWQEILKGYKSTEISPYQEYYGQDAETTARKYAEIRVKELIAIIDCLTANE